MSDTKSGLEKARADVESWFDMWTPKCQEDMDALIAAVRADEKAKCIAAVDGAWHADDRCGFYDVAVEAIRHA